MGLFQLHWEATGGVFLRIRLHFVLTFYCGAKTAGTRAELEDALGRYCSRPGGNDYLDGEFVGQQLRYVVRFEIF